MKHLFFIALASILLFSSCEEEKKKLPEFIKTDSKGAMHVFNNSISIGEEGKAELKEIMAIKNLDYPSKITLTDSLFKEMAKNPGEKATLIKDEQREINSLFWKNLMPYEKKMSDYRLEGIYNPKDSTCKIQEKFITPIERPSKLLVVVTMIFIFLVISLSILYRLYEEDEIDYAAALLFNFMLIITASIANLLLFWNEVGNIISLKTFTLSLTFIVLSGFSLLIGASAMVWNLRAWSFMRTSFLLVAIGLFLILLNIASGSILVFAILLLAIAIPAYVIAKMDWSEKMKVATAFFLVTSCDLAMGVFALLGLSALMGVEIGPLSVILAGFISIFPDMDFILEKMKTGEMTGKHKQNSLLHAPLSLYPTCLLIMPFSVFWSILSLIILSLHFLHDMEEDGPGVWLLWPFSKERWQIRRWWFSVVSDEDLERHYNTNAKEWALKDYFALKPRPIIGFLLFSLAMTVAATKVFF